VAELDDGGDLAWGDRHGDEAVYVLAGQLEVEGRVCPTGGAIIVEAGVPTVATARGPATIAYCSPADADSPSDGIYGPPDPDGHIVHIVGEKGWFRSGHRENVVAIWFADSTCPTCRISLFRVDHVAGHSGNLHSHSQDEIIYVLTGSVRLGSQDYGPGTALNIPANIHYRVSYPDGADFLNYRRDVSEQRKGRDGPPQLEGGLARGGEFVGDLR
jgi:quercetin dioxygenase-like cupin family protein